MEYCFDVKMNRYMGVLYRIKKIGDICYKEVKPSGALSWGDVPKGKKRLVFNFIRSYYTGLEAREVISGEYFAILEDGFLVGVGSVIRI